MQYGVVMKLYIFNIENFTETQYDKWYSLMSGEKKAKIDRMKVEKSKTKKDIMDCLVHKFLIFRLQNYTDSPNLAIHKKR